MHLYFLLCGIVFKMLRISPGSGTLMLANWMGSELSELFCACCWAWAMGSLMLANYIGNKLYETSECCGFRWPIEFGAFAVWGLWCL